MLRPPKALRPGIVCLLACLPASFAQDAAPSPPDRDNAAARAAYHQSGRTAKGENAADLLHRGYEQKLAMRQAEQQKKAEASRIQREGARNAPDPAGTPNFSNLVWQSLGPAPAVFDPTNLSTYGNVTGRVTAVTVDQNDSSGNTVYIGGASGGVWKSTNAASSDPNAVVWAPLTDDQPSLAVGAIALQPFGSVILVGTGESNGSGDSYYGQGILRSTDGGQTWTTISSANGGTRPFRGLGFSRIVFSTASNNLVVAAATSTNAATSNNGGEIQGANGRGIYYSTDAGQTWFYAIVNDPSGPTQPGSVGDVVYNPVHGKFYAAVRWHGYYSSTDGATWTRLAQQPGQIDSSGLCTTNPTNSACPEYRGTLSVREDTGETYTIFVDSSNRTIAGGGGIFVLTKDGGAWSQLGQTAIDLCGDPSGCGTAQGTYNLYIKAVPNGTNTDLYVGAINIFKCARNAGNAACTNPGWLNLTHVYGCSPNLGSISHLHPDQHGIDFSKSALPIHIYFGNDGGVWRAQDETALIFGNCGASNPFDDLNGSMGSLSEFVSFAQHPTDAGTILGGLQDNGSPTLVPGNAGASGIVWQGVNDSDGGYNAIDPTSPNVFYTSLSDVSVQRCLAGAACNQATWTSVVNSGTVDGDSAAFYPPYQLDPQSASQLVIGTCRIWRGPAAGGSYTPISLNFSENSSVICSSGDTEVRAIAMGGQTTGNGSQVIYAGLFGAAPLNGHVFVTTNADGGASTWVDRTGGINPSGYDISDIAISPYDSTGNTAYLTVMGFGTSHVFKTTDAGATWTDKTGNLPDVPANSVAVDPVTPGTIYLGTDVGVFLSTDDGTTWAELGTGLPNAPAVKLRTFVSGGVKKLRAATYGRGLWQVDLPQADINFFIAPPHFAAVVGRRSAAQDVTLTNNTGNPATVSNISASGDYLVSSGCPAVLSAGASCPITLTFTPHSAGTIVGSLTFLTNAFGGSRSLQLNGSGVDFSISALGPRVSRPSRGNVAGKIMLARGETARVELALSVANAQALVGLSLADRQARVACSAPAGIQCSVDSSEIDLTQPDTVIHLVISAQSAIKARRLRSLSAENLTVAVTAAAGTNMRTLSLPVTVY